MTLDPFRQRQVPSVAGRFLKERGRHQQQADLMWCGTLAAMFTDHELRLLDDLGYLSQHDRDLLSQAGRGAGRARPRPPTGGKRGFPQGRTPENG